MHRSAPLAALALLVAAAPAFADETFTVGEHTFHRRTLDNGLEALAVDDGQGGTISVFTVYGVGNRAETAATTGLAHLTEHALFTGTATTPAGAHDQAIKDLGGESNAYTRDDYTAYYAHSVPASALEQVLALEADRCRGLSWTPAAFAHERERLRVEELHSNQGDLQLGARRDEALWRGLGYGAGVQDEAGNTRGPTLTLAQVRAFYDAWYHPRRAAVVVVGGDPARSLDAIQAAFGELPAGPAAPELPGAPDDLAGREAVLRVALTRDRLEWVWAGPSLELPRDRLALTLLAELLEGRQAADGSALEAWMGGRAGPDLFVLGTTAADEQEAALAGAWEYLTSGAWGDAELAAAKERLRDSFTNKPLRARPYFSLAVDVAVLASLGHADYVAQLPARVDAIEREDLLRAAQLWLAGESKAVVRYSSTAEVTPLPSDGPGLRAAAQAAEASGDLERAIAAYERLIELGPGRVDLVIFRYSLGALNHRLGRLEEARRQLLLGLAVVEYPALRELLGEVEADMEAAGLSPEGAGDSGEEPTSRPQPPSGERPWETAETPASGRSLVGTSGEAPPAWVNDEGTQVMAQLEAWRGLPFQTDLTVELRQADPEGPAGWYEPDTKRLVVTLRGTQRFQRGTMLHEMFHALQDQHYDLARVHGAVETLDGETAVTALIEGEAMLAVQEIMSYDFSRHAHVPAEGPLDEDRFAKVFHYGAGLQFVLAVREARGWEGVRRVFADPPTSTAEILHPERYLAGWRAPSALSLGRPTLARGESVLETRADGEYGLRLFLARSPETRPLHEEVGAALRVDAHHLIQTSDGGIRHVWRLRFGTGEGDGSGAAAAARAAEALSGAYLPALEALTGRPGVELQASCVQHSAEVVLRWRDPR